MITIETKNGKSTLDIESKDDLKDHVINVLGKPHLGSKSYNKIMFTMDDLPILLDLTFLINKGSINIQGSTDLYTYLELDSRISEVYRHGSYKNEEVVSFDMTNYKYSGYSVTRVYTVIQLLDKLGFKQEGGACESLSKQEYHDKFLKNINN